MLFCHDSVSWSTGYKNEKPKAFHLHYNAWPWELRSWGWMPLFLWFLSRWAYEKARRAFVCLSWRSESALVCVYGDHCGGEEMLVSQLYKFMRTALVTILGNVDYNKVSLAKNYFKLVKKWLKMSTAYKYNAKSTIAIQITQYFNCIRRHIMAIIGVNQRKCFSDWKVN